MSNWVERSRKAYKTRELVEIKLYIEIQKWGLEILKSKITQSNEIER